MIGQQTWAALCGGLAVFFAVLVVVDFVGFVMARYRERFIKQAAVELDDVLLHMPPGKILDISLALSALAGFTAMACFGMGASNWSWNKIAVSGLLAAAAAFPLPRAYLRFLSKRRLQRFNEQLEDALTIMANNLKAGFSISQAVEAVASDNRPPISVEFRMLVQESRLGVSLDDALCKMRERLRSDDFELVATAIITARQTGGELTAVFERLAAMIRERARINGRLRALTAQGKLQAIVISLAPVVLIFLLLHFTPAMGWRCSAWSSCWSWPAISSSKKSPPSTSEAEP